MSICFDFLMLGKSTKTFLKPKKKNSIFVKYAIRGTIVTYQESNINSNAEQVQRYNDF